MGFTHATRTHLLVHCRVGQTFDVVEVRFLHRVNDRRSLLFCFEGVIPQV